jgi:hypothetical protein
LGVRVDELRLRSLKELFATAELASLRTVVQTIGVPAPAGSGGENAHDREERRWFLHFGIWTLLGLSFAGQNYFSAMAFGNSVPLSRALRTGLCDWYVLGALFYPTQWVCRRFPLERRLLGRNAGLHLLFGALFSLAHIVLYILVQGALNPQAFAFKERPHVLVHSAFPRQSFLLFTRLDASRSGSQKLLGLLRPSS